MRCCSAGNAPAVSRYYCSDVATSVASHTCSDSVASVVMRTCSDAVVPAASRYCSNLRFSRLAATVFMPHRAIREELNYTAQSFLRGIKLNYSAPTDT